MDRRALVACVASAAITLQQAAWAQGPAPAAEALRDVGVATRDGALYRGELVEKVPGDHLTIRLASGEVKRFAWADVADVATAPAGEKKEDAKKDDERPQVHLVVDGEPGLWLERRESSSEAWTATIWPGYAYAEQWEAACVAPCRTTVDAGSTYRVNGPGVTTSHDFTLPPTSEPLKLHLVGRSLLLHDTAVLLTIAGGLVTLAGTASVFAAPAISDSGVEGTVRGLGIAGLGAGVLMLAVGIPTWIATISSARTADGRTLGRAATPRLLSF